MPHIIVQGCDLSKVMQHVSLHANVHFKKEFFEQVSARMLEELEEKILHLIEEYFNNPDSIILSNHDYNTLMDHEM